MGQRLLLLACSARKITTPGEIPALDRYDGPAYRTLRAALRAQPQPGLDILILSAEYGLFDARWPIAAYDRRMNLQRAIHLRPQCRQVLARTVSLYGPYAATHISLGKDYLPAIVLDEVLHGLGSLSSGEGGIGDRLGALKRWVAAGQTPAGT